MPPPSLSLNNSEYVQSGNMYSLSYDLVSGGSSCSTSVLKTVAACSVLPLTTFLGLSDAGIGVTVTVPTGGHSGSGGTRELLGLLPISSPHSLENEPNSVCFCMSLIASLVATVMLLMAGKLVHYE